MKTKSSEELVEDLDKGLGNGPLTLGIYCCECNAQFELNREAVAMAFMMNTPLIEYVRFVQSAKCSVCGKGGS